MSFDLYVWHEPNPISAERARTTCHLLASGDDQVVQPQPQNLAFQAELLERFPDPDDPAEDELDDIVWSISPDVNDRRSILCVGWSSADEFAEVAVELAGKHGLICFDPQSGQVRNPPGR